MVARSGRGWQLAPCLVAMEEEANRLAPNRNRKADGSIGDQAHASRTSDHNPNNGWVTALDLTHAPESGFDAHARARAVVARHDHRIKYVISNGQIARSYDKPGIRAWSWAPYTGSNPHRLHAHFSIENTPAARNDTTPWWPHATPGTPKEADDVEPNVFVPLVYFAILGRFPSLEEIAHGAQRVREIGQGAYWNAVMASKEAQSEKARRHRGEKV